MNLDREPEMSNAEISKGQRFEICPAPTKTHGDSLNRRKMIMNDPFLDGGLETAAPSKGTGRIGSEGIKASAYREAANGFRAF